MVCGRGQENSNAHNDLIRRSNVFCKDYNELLKVCKISIVSVNIYNAILPHLVESPVDHTVWLLVNKFSDFLTSESNSRAQLYIHGNNVLLRHIIFFSTYLYELYINVQCTDMPSCTFCAPHMDLSWLSDQSQRFRRSSHSWSRFVFFKPRLYLLLPYGPFLSCFLFRLNFIYVFPLPPLFSLLFLPKFQSLFWFYFLFLTTLPLIRMIFVVHFLLFGTAIPFLLPAFFWIFVGQYYY